MRVSSKNNPRKQKKAAKKAVKAINERAKKAPAKSYGKAVMKDDPRKPGRKMGYATVTKTELPDYHKPKKAKKTVAAKRSTRKKMY